jgi:hypothetical protein
MFGTATSIFDGSAQASMLASGRPAPGGWEDRMARFLFRLELVDGAPASVRECHQHASRCGEDLVDLPVDVEAAHLLEVGRALSR